MPLVCFLSIVFVYTLSINVLDVSQILVGSVIFGAKPDDLLTGKWDDNNVNARITHKIYSFVSNLRNTHLAIRLHNRSAGYRNPFKFPGNISVLNILMNPMFLSHHFLKNLVTYIYSIILRLLQFVIS